MRKGPGTEQQPVHVLPPNAGFAGYRGRGASRKRSTPHARQPQAGRPQPVAAQAAAAVHIVCSARVDSRRCLLCAVCLGRCFASYPERTTLLVHLRVVGDGGMVQNVCCCQGKTPLTALPCTIPRKQPMFFVHVGSTIGFVGVLDGFHLICQGFKGFLVAEGVLARGDITRHCHPSFRTT